MQRLGGSSRVAAQFSLPFVSIEIRWAPARQRPAAPEAEQAAARADLARALDRDRVRAERRLMLRG